MTWAGGSLRLGTGARGGRVGNGGVLASASCADSVTVVASRDNTIFQAFPSNGDGAGQVMFVGTTGARSPQRALIGFDIAGNEPAGSTITSVQLRLVLDRAAASDS